MNTTGVLYVVYIANMLHLKSSKTPCGNIKILQPKRPRNEKPANIFKWNSMSLRFPNFQLVKVCTKFKSIRIKFWQIQWFKWRIQQIQTKTQKTCKVVFNKVTSLNFLRSCSFKRSSQVKIQKFPNPRHQNPWLNHPETDNDKNRTNKAANQSES